MPGRGSSVGSAPEVGAASAVEAVRAAAVTARPATRRVVVMVFSFGVVSVAWSDGGGRSSVARRSQRARVRSVSGGATDPWAARGPWRSRADRAAPDGAAAAGGVCGAPERPARRRRADRRAVAGRCAPLGGAHAAHSRSPVSARPIGARLHRRHRRPATTSAPTSPWTPTASSASSTRPPAPAGSRRGRACWRLWRGDPLVELADWAPAAAERARLVELGHAAREGWCEAAIAQLRRGRRRCGVGAAGAGRAVARAPLGAADPRPRRRGKASGGVAGL